MNVPPDIATFDCTLPCRATPAPRGFASRPCPERITAWLTNGVALRRAPSVGPFGPGGAPRRTRRMNPAVFY